MEPARLTGEVSACSILLLPYWQVPSHGCWGWSDQRRRPGCSEVVLLWNAANTPCLGGMAMWVGLALLPLPMLMGAVVVVVVVVAAATVGFSSSSTPAKKD